jgi:2-C-methyl-D-erythritol 2,4-cyclodiphosphate synthase
LSQIRTGLGWDVHRIATGRPLILGGVTVESDFGLEGHSDADVLSHAITDAILGAAALGDIGMHFPDTDPRWKGCDSLVFLRHAQELAIEKGYHVVNVDSTVILERPKLKDYRPPIREKLASTLGLEVDRVSVKFKTAEKVGPVGEGRSAEAQAIVTLERRDWAGGMLEDVSLTAERIRQLEEKARRLLREKKPDTA